LTEQIACRWEVKIEMDALATLNGTDDLQVALRARADSMNISRLDIDRLAGFTGGYASKVLAPTPIKGLGIDSMFALVAALGCDLVLIENAQTTAHIKGRTVPRRESFKQNAVVHLRFSNRFMRKIGRKGGKASRANMPREQASELGRRAARARWGKAA
jgi:hypothetical protein